MTVEHWHVQRHTEDDDVFVTTDVVTALGYAADELNLITESEHENIRLHGEAGEFEQAYRAFDHVQAWSVLVANLRTLVANAEKYPGYRAPLYQAEPQFGPKWSTARDHVLETLNSEGPAGFTMWSCASSDCELSKK